MIHTPPGPFPNSPASPPRLHQKTSLTFFFPIPPPASTGRALSPNICILHMSYISPSSLAQRNRQKQKFNYYIIFHFRLLNPCRIRHLRPLGRRLHQKPPSFPLFHSRSPPSKTSVRKIRADPEFRHITNLPLIALKYSC